MFLYKACVPGATRSWGWGRGGAAAPLSRLGYAVWGVTFATIGLVVGFEREKVPVWLAAWLAADFVAILAVGFRDVHAHRRSP